ncbi:MAG: SGNH/GDSL hydrolase family protein [Bdellovibrionales bacterium]|nr:SGNH/GDSL hydrolase family protein [Bdellovibrionales bacterium]
MGKRITFSISAVSIGLLLALMLIEGTMRFVGWQLSQRSDSTNRPFRPSAPHDENEFRIVCLGESTTAPLYVANRNVAWPGALERKLNSLGLGRNFRTITIAKHGTSSPFLLRDLERDIDKIDPHLVISMMGINDLSSLEYFQREDWLGSLRTMKLANWLAQSPTTIQARHQSRRKS